MRVGIVKEFEAIEDFNGATTLNANDATENPRRSRGIGRGGGGGVTAVGGGWLRLDFDTCMVIGDVDDDERMKFEG